MPEEFGETENPETSGLTRRRICQREGGEYSPDFIDESWGNLDGSRIHEKTHGELQRRSWRAQVYFRCFPGVLQ